MWWYILENNVPQNGINDDQIAEAVRSGRVQPSTLLATDISPEWRQASEYFQLRTFFEERHSSVKLSVADPYTGVIQSRMKSPEAERKEENTAIKVSPEKVFALEEPVSGEGVCRCPHCLKKFSRDRVMYISQHPSLFGDDMLPDEQQRFFPEKFDSAGQVLDSGGFVCTEIACPHCHLRLPSTIIELESLYFSIVGAPASGKSYFLTSMIHRLKYWMARFFDVDFCDADPVGNSMLSGFESRLFLSDRPDELTSLEKTQLSGEMYNVVQMAGRAVNLPKPFVYKMHAQWPTSRGIRDWNVVFYDNAGEHFQPGADNFTNPGGRHLVHSDGIIFLFDPTADVRFRNRIPDDNGLINSSKVQNQMILLDETLSRLRRYKQIDADGKYGKPFIVSVSKFDTWTDLSPLDLEQMQPQAFDVDSNMAGCNAYLMENVSYYTREILLKYVPEFVSAVEAGAKDVVYLPNSSLGCCPERDPATGAWGVKPKNIAPVWVEAPILWMLMRSGLVNEFRKMPDENTLRISNYAMNEDYIVFTDPVRKNRMRMPRSWAGRLITMHADGYRFIIPGAEEESESSVQEDSAPTPAAPTPAVPTPAVPTPAVPTVAAAVPAAFPTSERSVEEA